MIAVDPAIKRVRVFWCLAGLAWLIALAQLGYAVWANEFSGYRGRLPPNIEALKTYAVYVCLGLPILASLWLLIMRPLRGVRHWWMVVIAMLLAFVAPLGVSITALVSTGLFKGKYITKIYAPSDKTTYYLYTKGLFCGYQIWGQRQGEFYLQPVRSQEVECDRRHEFVRLMEIDGKVEIVDGEGHPVSSPRTDYTGLYWH